MRPRHTLLILTLASLLAGCTGGGGPGGNDKADAIAPTTLDETWNVASRGSRELNFEMQQGGTISFTVSSSAEVRYDLHSHGDDGKTAYHEQGRGREWGGNFTAPVDDVYSIFVAGNGSTSVVKVHVEGPFRVKG